jgi:hypothetical protein
MNETEKAGTKMTDVTAWRSFMAQLANDVEFQPGASEAQIIEAEKAIKTPLPEHLRALLLESDGVQADNSTDIIWSCSELAKRNNEFRIDEGFRDFYMPFDNLLFIGDDGGGNQFAFGVVSSGMITRQDIYRWDHETDGRAWFSRDLEQYLERRLSPLYYEQ